jgi:hypothetical protein
MKTIKQIADEIGVSKQAVYKKIKKEPLSTDLPGLSTKTDNGLLIGLQGETLIKSVFFTKEQSTDDSKPLSTCKPTESIGLQQENVINTEFFAKKQSTDDSKPLSTGKPTVSTCLQQENVINTEFSARKQSTAHIAVDCEVIALLKENLSVLQAQLIEKDKQISDLTETIKAQAQSINADRHNELAETIQQQLIGASPDNEVGADEPQPSTKQSKFGRAFRILMGKE